MRVVSSRRDRALASDVATTVLTSAVKGASAVTGTVQGCDTVVDGGLMWYLDARTLSFLGATPLCALPCSAYSPPSFFLVS